MSRVWIVLRVDVFETYIEGVFLDPRPAEALRADGERQLHGYRWIVEEHEVRDVPVLVNL